MCRNEPSASIGDKYEEIVDSGWIKSLDETVPTLIATSCAERDLPPTRSKDRTGLDLDSHESAICFGDEVAVGAMPKRKVYGMAVRTQPLDRGYLAKISLAAWRKHSHGTNICSGQDGTRTGQLASRSSWASGRVCSFLRVRLSIWRTRSRVMLKAWPTSSSVRTRPPVMP